MPNQDIIDIQDAMENEVGELFTVTMYSVQPEDTGKEGDYVGLPEGQYPTRQFWGVISDNSQEPSANGQTVVYTYTITISSIAGYIPILDDVVLVEGQKCTITSVKNTKVRGEIYTYDFEVRV